MKLNNLSKFTANEVQEAWIDAQATIDKGGRSIARRAAEGRDLTEALAEYRRAELVGWALGEVFDVLASADSKARS